MATSLLWRVLRAIDVGVVNRQEMFGVGQWLESELGVEAVGVAGGEEKAAEALEFGLVENGAEEEFGDAALAVFGHDKNVREISEGGKIGDDAGEGDLAVGQIGAEGEGILDGFFD